MQYREAAVVPRESILRAEAEWLSSIKADLVVTLSALWSLLLFGDQTFNQCSTDGCRRCVWATSELSSELAVLLGQVSDVVPIVCRVASDLGVCSVCIGNFRCASPSLYCLHLGLPF